MLRAAWLPRFALISGVVALLGLAAINPDAWIARQNLDRWNETGRIDWTFLRTLSDDAVPVLAEFPVVSDKTPEPFDARRCALANRQAPDDDWLEWNLGRSRASGHLPGPELTPDQLTSLCPDS